MCYVALQRTPGTASMQYNKNICELAMFEGKTSFDKVVLWRAVCSAFRSINVCKSQVANAASRRCGTYNYIYNFLAEGFIEN